MESATTNVQAKEPIPSRLDVARRVASLLLFRGWRDLLLCAGRGKVESAADPLALKAVEPLLVLGVGEAFIVAQLLGWGKPVFCGVLILLATATAGWISFRVRRFAHDDAELSPLDRQAKETLTGFCLTLLSVFIAFIALELYLSIKPPVSPGGLTFDQRQGLRLAPQPGLTNSLGFHDRERSLRKPPKTFRVVALGDSFTFGCCRREQNFPALLEEGLKKHLNSPAEVINLGVPSTGPPDYLHVLKVLGLEYQPDVVLVNVFVGNDFELAVNPSGGDVYVQGIRLSPPRFWYSRFWVGNWVLFSYLSARMKVWRTTQAPPTATGKKQVTPAVTTFSQDDYEQYVHGHLRICRRGDSWAQSRLKKGVGWLDLIHKVCKQRRVPLAIALLPDEFQVDDALRKRVLKRFNDKATAYELDQPQQAIIKFARSRQIPVVDMLSNFRAAGRKEQLYLPLNTHWNEAGNRLAAELLLKELTPLAKK
jgi:lysophospholipase L1-like esterase